MGQCGVSQSRTRRCDRAILVLHALHRLVHQQWKAPQVVPWVGYLVMKSAHTNTRDDSISSCDNKIHHCGSTVARMASVWHSMLQSSRKHAMLQSSRKDGPLPLGAWLLSQPFGCIPVMPGLPDALRRGQLLHPHCGPDACPFPESASFDERMMLTKWAVAHSLWVTPGNLHDRPLL
jgi:hypothetical protein